MKHGIVATLPARLLNWQPSTTTFCAIAVAVLVQVARDCRALPQGLLHAVLGCDWICVCCSRIDT